MLRGTMIAVLLASLSVGGASGQSPIIEVAAVPNEADTARREILRPLNENAKLFREFSASLLRLAQRLEKSEKPADQERAKVLRKAIELADKEGVDNQFSKLIATLTNSKTVTINELDQAASQNEELSKALREILAVLLTDDDAARLRAEIERNEKILKELNRLIREQKIHATITETGRGSKDKLERDQRNLAKKTEDLSGKMGGKDGKDGEGKDGEGKDGEGKDGEGKDGEGKDGEGKDGEGKDGEGKDGEGKDGEGKDGEGKDGEGKDGEGKDGEGKDGEGKDGEGKDGKGGEGSEGEGSEGEGSEGEGSEGQPGQGQEGQGQEGQPGQQGQQQPQVPGREKVADAIPHQNKAADDINKDDRDKATKEEYEAIEKLEQAKKELEERLKQLREEELERLLANLENRVNAMLQMQIEVYEGTKKIHADIEKKSGDIDRLQSQKSQELADKEGKIVDMANETIKLLEGEGSAVAFPQILDETRMDMANVRNRLEQVKVGEDTQYIEEDIIAALKEMLEALKKQREQNKADSQSGESGESGQPADPKLIDLIAELKMLKSLQVRVNNRTTKYSEKYEGEQTGDPLIKSELNELSQRQERILEMTKDIAYGRNE